VGIGIGLLSMELELKNINWKNWIGIE